MRHEVKLPNLGDETTEAALVSLWLFEEGDEVEEGEDLVEMQTDKAAFSLPSPKSGRLVEKFVEEGEDITVGETLCVIEV